MKTKKTKKALTFGQFIVAVYDVWDERTGLEIVRRLVNTHALEFRGKHFSILDSPTDKNSNTQTL
ncbi:MAG: hypothetical protein ACXWBP_06695 [Limisphaerales bacterium]